MTTEEFEAFMAAGEQIAIQFGAAASDAELDECLKLTHDYLIDSYPVRLSAVVWSIYPMSECDRMTEAAGGAYAGPEGDGLREFCRANPQGHLVLAGVAVPA